MGASGDSNEASATPRAPSDLIVPALAAPSSAGAGAAIVLSVTTKNQGGGTAGPSTTRIYLSNNLVQDPNDVQLDGWQTVSELAPEPRLVSASHDSIRNSCRKEISSPKPMPTAT
jgi:subtilase family serine protease